MKPDTAGPPDQIASGHDAGSPIGVSGMCATPEGRAPAETRRQDSMRLRLASLVVACVLPLWIAAGFLVYYNYQSRRAITEQRMLETARALTMVVDRELANMQAGLSVLATSPSLVSADLRAFYRQAQAVQEGRPGAYIILVNASAQELANTLHPFGALLPKHSMPDAVRQVYATKRPLISNVFAGLRTGSILIGVHVPVFRDYQVIYDLAMIVPVDRFAAILWQQHLPPEWVGTIVDNDHVVVARTHLQEKLVGHLSGPVLLQRMVEAAEGTVELTNLEGIRVFDSFSRSATSGWTVVIGVPKAIVMAEIWRWLWWIVAGTALLSITGITVAVMQGRSIARSSARDAELAAIMDVVPALTFIAQDPECRRMVSSRAAHELLRVPNGAETSNSAAQDERSSNFRVMRDGQELPSNELPVQMAAKTGREVRGAEFSLVFEDESSHDLFGNAVPLLDDRGGVRGAVGAFIDITERKRVEREAVAAKELAEKTLAQFRANIDSMSEGMYVMGTDGKRLLTNPAYFRIHGFDPAPSEEFVSSISALLERYDLNGRLLSPEEWPVSRALRGETVLHSQQRVRRIDTGNEVILSVNAAPVRDGAGKVTLAVVTIEDITTQKQSEAALIRSEKLATVGRMAATIAHEINNPLAAVMNALFITKSLKDLPESARYYLDMADAELKRIAHITRQSLGFYRESNAPALTSVKAVLESAVDLLKSRIKAKHAGIEKQWDKDVEITAVTGELRQVFSNLLANSLDAIDEKGIIKFRVSSTSFKNGVRCVRVTIADNGKGISANYLSHIFEPFFTTKGAIGTGLGLWVSKQIIDKHGGTIRVRSSSRGARRGTVFSVVLPIDAAAAAHSQSGGGKDIERSVDSILHAGDSKRTNDVSG
jgi:PAS domain S-box-containing protein